MERALTGPLVFLEYCVRELIPDGFNQRIGIWPICASSIALSNTKVRPFK